MCQDCHGLLAMEDQVKAAHDKVVREGVRWARSGLLHGIDATSAWSQMAKALEQDAECSRSNFAYLLAAAYVRAAQDELPGEG
jgi:hypothetical protein